MRKAKVDETRLGIRGRIAARVSYLDYEDFFLLDRVWVELFISSVLLDFICFVFWLVLL